VNLILLRIEKLIEKVHLILNSKMYRVNQSRLANSLVDMILLHVEKFIENVRSFSNSQTLLLKRSSLVDILLLHIEKFIEKVRLVFSTKWVRLMPRNIDFLPEERRMQQ
jgi:hypothetical protein